MLSGKGQDNSDFSGVDETFVELTRRERGNVMMKRAISAIAGTVMCFQWMLRVSRPAVTIIVYHRIAPENIRGVVPYISVRRDELLRQFRFFKRYYAVISLEEAVTRLRDGSVDRHYLVVTFDDGYMDNYTLGTGLFAAEGIRPAIFITTGCTDQRILLWPDRVREIVYSAPLKKPVQIGTPNVSLEGGIQSRIKTVKTIIKYLKSRNADYRACYLAGLERSLNAWHRPADLMLDWDSVRRLAQSGATIGSHTCTHTILSSLREGEIMDEIGISKERLEAELGKPVHYFAYPNGTEKDFNGTAVEHLKKAGYEAALTTIRGCNRPGADLYRLRRTGIYHTDTLLDIKMKLGRELAL